MSVLDRAALEQSPLADLHAIASELSIDGFRRLRRAELIDAIIARQGGPEETEPADEEEPSRAELAVVEESESAGEAEQRPAGRRRRGRRGGRGRGAREDLRVVEEEEPEDEEPDNEPVPGLEQVEEAGGEQAWDEEAGREEAGRDEPGRGEAGRGEAGRDEAGRGEAGREEEPSVEGVVELLPNGSAFLRVSPPEPSDDDVYVSAAQVKRCELVSGDRVAGPRRAPRRSERFASLVRVDTINGRPAADLVSGARFEDLPAAFPAEHFAFGSLDPTLKAIESLTPFGKGSRVTICGGPRAGKTEALRRLAAALAGRPELQLSIALAGVRPEEIAEWRGGPVEPLSAVSFAASADAQDNAVELVIDQARRVASRGGHAVVLVDCLDGMHAHAARKVLAAARRIVDGGSLTVIATASKPLGGETTVIALDAELTSTGRFPALDLLKSGTLRPELLVGDAGAEAIANARREAIER